MSSDVESLRQEVHALSGELSEVRKTVDDLNTNLPTRVATLENRVSTVETRMSRIDAILLEVQGDVRFIQRAVTAMSAEQNGKLDELRLMVQRILNNVDKQAIPSNAT